MARISIKEYLPGGAGQLASLADAARFFAALLVLTLVARGTGGAAMPRVETTAPRAAALTESFTAAGTVAVQAGKPFRLPAGLLVTEVCVEPGAQVAAGSTLARVDTQQLDLAVRQAQAELKQMQVSYAQGMEPAKADDYGVRQSQDRLTEAYADSRAVWDKGEENVRRAQAKLDDARRALEAARADTPPPPPAAPAPATPETATPETVTPEAVTPESAADLWQAYEQARAAWEARVAAAEGEAAAAEAALEAAQQAAEAANEAALDRAESAEQTRDSALHSYEQALESAQKTAAANQAAAGVTAAGIAAKQAELERLLTLQQNGGAVLAPCSGTVTALALAPGGSTPAVGGLLAGLGTDSVLTFTLAKAQAAWARPGMPVTVTQGDRTLETTLRSVGPADADGAVQAAVTLPADGGWQAGGATVRLTAARGTWPLCLPAAAIHTESSGSFVYKVEEQDTVLGRRNVLVRVPVNVEERGGALAAVSGALAGGDAVVVSADRPLSAGARVRLAG